MGVVLSFGLLLVVVVVGVLVVGWFKDPVFIAGAVFVLLRRDDREGLVLEDDDPVVGVPLAGLLLAAPEGEGVGPDRGEDEHVRVAGPLVAADREVDRRGAAAAVDHERLAGERHHAVADELADALEVAPGPVDVFDPLAEPLLAPVAEDPVVAGPRLQGEGLLPLDGLAAEVVELVERQLHLHPLRGVGEGDGDDGGLVAVDPALLHGQRHALLRGEGDDLAVELGAEGLAIADRVLRPTGLESVVVEPVEVAAGPGEVDPEAGPEHPFELAPVLVGFERHADPAGDHSVVGPDPDPATVGVVDVGRADGPAEADDLLHGHRKILLFTCGVHGGASRASCAEVA